MKVNDASEILNARLLTSPVVNRFDKITSDIDKVERNTLYIAQNIENVKIAIEKGAYSILSEFGIETVINFDGNLSKNDMANLRQQIGEIAYLHTKNLRESMMRLIRYNILAERITLIFMGDIEYEIAQNIITDKNAIVFDGDLSQLCEITCRGEIKHILIKNQEFADLSLEKIKSSVPEFLPFDVITTNLFDIKIFFRSKTYEINIPKLFIRELSAVISVLESERVEFNLEKYASISHLKPNFILPNYRVGKHGESMKVVIVEKDIANFRKYMSYIATNATWGKMLFVMPEPYIEVFDNIAKTLSYKNNAEVINYIKIENYHFMLVLGIDNQFLLNSLNPPIIEPNLFSDL